MFLATLQPEQNQRDTSQMLGQQCNPDVSVFFDFCCSTAMNTKLDGLISFTDNRLPLRLPHWNNAILPGGGGWSHPLLLMICSLSHLNTLLTSYHSNKPFLWYAESFALTLSHARQISQIDKYSPPRPTLSGLHYLLLWRRSLGCPPVLTCQTRPWCWNMPFVSFFLSEWNHEVTRRHKFADLFLQPLAPEQSVFDLCHE